VTGPEQRSADHLYRTIDANERHGVVGNAEHRGDGRGYDVGLLGLSLGVVERVEPARDEHRGKHGTGDIMEARHRLRATRRPARANNVNRCEQAREG